MKYASTSVKIITVSLFLDTTIDTFLESSMGRQGIFHYRILVSGWYEICGMKYVVCYSGGHSSALVAIEAVRKVGKENVILLNHDISGKVEHEDIKRFKKEIADYLGIEITYANCELDCEMTPISVCLKVGAFQATVGQALCTYNLKAKPFYDWLKENYPVEKGSVCEDIVVLYGFDMNEQHRIQRRSSIMATSGYRTDYPLALWDRTIEKTEDIGIERPRTYRIFKHANCIGCLKAGKQHWYIVYCLRNDIFQEALEAEKKLGYSIIKGVYLEELIPKYEEMKSSGICPNDIENSASFWKKVRHSIPEQIGFLPCDCAVL